MNTRQKILFLISVPVIMFLLMAIGIYVDKAIWSYYLFSFMLPLGGFIYVLGFIVWFQVKQSKAS